MSTGTTTIRVSREARRKLKVLAANRAISIQALMEELAERTTAEAANAQAKKAKE